MFNNVAFLRLRGKRAVVALAILGVTMAGCGKEDSTSASRLTPTSATSAAPDLSPAIRSYPCLTASDVSEQRLVETIERFGPVSSISIAGMLHCIRFRDVQPRPTIPGEEVLSIDDVLELVCDHSAFERQYGHARPCVLKTPHGMRFSEASWTPTPTETSTREAHVGQTLSVLGELGMPPSHALRAPDDVGNVRDVVNDMTATFNLSQEPYWTTIALALYLPPQTEWTNKFGHCFSFDDLAAKLTASPVGEAGPCGGAHALYAIAVLLQVNDQYPILSPASQRDATAFLRQAAQELEQSQHPDGSWDDLWTRRQLSHAKLIGRKLLAPESTRGLWITGHHLEWMAIVPAELRTSDDRLRRAAQYVLRETARIPTEMLRSEPCRFSHGLRAIQLLTLHE
jgi:hypothetical protein